MCPMQIVARRVLQIESAVDGFLSGYKRACFHGSQHAQIVEMITAHLQTRQCKLGTMEIIPVREM
jgi:hypothetical protein